MKKMLFAIILFLPLIAIAGTNQNVPNAFGYYGYLTDEGGNPLPDGQTKVKFEIIDHLGNSLYAEEQILDVTKGYVNALVGNGSGMGIDPAILKPDGVKYLKIEAEGYKSYDPLELVSTPYSYWADIALKVADGSIMSSMISEGAIKKEHLDKELFESIFPGGLPKNLLPADTIYTQDFQGFKDLIQGPLGAGRIGVDSTFINSGSATVQGVVRDLDIAVKKRGDEITNEAGTRAASDVNILLQINNHSGSGSAHGSDGSIVGINTLNNALNALSLNFSSSMPPMPYKIGEGWIQYDSNSGVTDSKGLFVQISEIPSVITHSIRSSDQGGFPYNPIYLTKTTSNFVRTNGTAHLGCSIKVGDVYHRSTREDKQEEAIDISLNGCNASIGFVFRVNYAVYAWDI